MSRDHKSPVGEGGFLLSLNLVIMKQIEISEYFGEHIIIKYIVHVNIYHKIAWTLHEIHLGRL